MTIGVGLNSIINSYRPSFVWDPINAVNSLKGVNFTVEDIDLIGNNDPVTIWDPSNERFSVVTPDTNPDKALGSVGDFSDGKVSQYYSPYWTATNLGFSVSSPTTSGALGQLAGTPPDILDTTYNMDVTYVDTDTEAQDSVIEVSEFPSSTYQRVFQILVKSIDGNSPVGNVQIGFNGSSGTRLTSSDTWCRELPTSKGWWAVSYICPTGSSTIYITMSFKKSTGRWLLAAPMYYSKWSTMENITRAPIPRTEADMFERGQYQVSTTNSELSIPVSGWLAMSIVMPDRSASNGHLDYSGASSYDFSGLLSWISSTYRLRVIMSSSVNNLAVQMDNGGTSFAFLDLGDDWVDFEKIGLVVSWGISNGVEFAYLYVNGKKYDSVYGTSDWYPNNLASSKIFIGANGDGGAAADCWVSKVAIGRKPLYRSDARKLSIKMRNVARGGVIGEM